MALSSKNKVSGVGDLIYIIKVSDIEGRLHVCNRGRLHGVSYIWCDVKTPDARAVAYAEDAVKHRCIKNLNCDERDCLRGRCPS